MSRSGYSDYGGDDNVWQSIKWGGQLKAGLFGRRAQEMLADLVNALDAMPVKELAWGTFQSHEEGVCALGCVAKARDIDVSDLNAKEYDEYDSQWTAEQVAARLNIPFAVACHVMHVNDADYDDERFGRWGPETAKEVKRRREKRWKRVRQWAVYQMEEALKRGDR